jgi:hypothetical protein
MWTTTTMTKQQKKKLTPLTELVFVRYIRQK